MTSDLAASVALALVQVALVARAVAPLLLGITKQRQGAPPVPARPVAPAAVPRPAKWWGKEAVESDTASAADRGWRRRSSWPRWSSPSLLVPIVGRSAAARGLGRPAGRRRAAGARAVRPGARRARRRQRVRRHGRSREVAIATLVEPALLLALAVAVAGGRLHRPGRDRDRTARAAGSGLVLAPPLLLAAAAFAIVAVAETGHEPVDNPDTHLELTMIHEGMLLEASGPPAGHADATRPSSSSWSWSGLFAAVFLPIGAGRRSSTPGALARRRRRRARQAGRRRGRPSGVLDASLAKLRILALPASLASASIARPDGAGRAALAAGMSSTRDRRRDRRRLRGGDRRARRAARAVTRSIGRSIWLVAAPVRPGRPRRARRRARHRRRATWSLGGLLAHRGQGRSSCPLVLGSILRRSSVRVERHPLPGPAAVARRRGRDRVRGRAAAADGVSPSAGVGREPRAAGRDRRGADRAAHRDDPAQGALAR